MAQDQAQNQDSPAPRKKKNWSEHPTLRFLMVGFVLFGLYWGYGYMTGPSRITARLQARLSENPEEVNITVTTKFPPEEFHISIYQQLGSMRGVQESTAALYTVTPGNVRILSQYYWMEKIDMIPKGVDMILK
jgi:hypothetical protein